LYLVRVRVGVGVRVRVRVGVGVRVKVRVGVGVRVGVRAHRVVAALDVLLVRARPENRGEIGGSRAGKAAASEAAH